MSASIPLPLDRTRLVRALDALRARGGDAMRVRIERREHFQRAAATLLRKSAFQAVILCPDRERAWAVRVAIARFIPLHRPITVAPFTNCAACEIIVTPGTSLSGGMSDTVIVSDADAATYPDTPAAIATLARAIARADRLVVFVAVAPWSPALDGLGIDRRVFVPQPDPHPCDLSIKAPPYPYAFAAYGGTEDRYDEESWP